MAKKRIIMIRNKDIDPFRQFLSKAQTFRATITTAKGKERDRIKEQCPMGANHIRDASRVLRLKNFKRAEILRKRNKEFRVEMEETLESLSKKMLDGHIDLDSFWSKDFSGRVPEKGDKP